MKAWFGIHLSITVLQSTIDTSQWLLTLIESYAAIRSVSLLKPLSHSFGHRSHLFHGFQHAGERDCRARGQARGHVRRTSISTAIRAWFHQRLPSKVQSVPARDIRTCLTVNRQRYKVSRAGQARESHQLSGHQTVGDFNRVWSHRWQYRRQHDLLRDPPYFSW